MLNTIGFPEPDTTNFKARVLDPAGLLLCFMYSFLMGAGLILDLNAIHHSIIQDNLDLSPSLITGFVQLCSENPKVNATHSSVSPYDFCFISG